MRCAVVNCFTDNKNKSSPCSFFAFPTNVVLSKKWMQFCQRPNYFNPKTSAICMKHFTSDDFENSLQYNMGLAKKRLLKRGTVPTIFKCDPAYPECAKRVHHCANKISSKIFNDMPEQIKTEDKVKYKNIRTEISAKFIIDVSMEEFPKNFEEETQRLCPKENDFLTSAPHHHIHYDCSSYEVEDLRTKLEVLQRENALLLKENKDQCNDLTALKRDFASQQEKHAWEMESLRNRLVVMEAEYRNMEKRLASIFTKGQINKMKNDAKSLTWTENDIAQSITLYAGSPKAYRLMYKQGFPLPAVRTLQSWAQKIEISAGLIHPVCKLLSATTHMDILQKLCVLSFDEVKIRQTYDTSADSALSSANYVQVAMLRGLISKWKQPVFYDFDCRMTDHALKNILQTSQKCGLNVVAVVCDFSQSNISLLDELEVTENKPWFLFKEQKVFVFANVPHLLKSLRNHFVKHGLIIDGKPVKKGIISDLLSCTFTDFTITHKISAIDLSITVTNQQKSAVKFFSNTVGQAITKAASLGYLNGQNWNECFQLFKITNDWFDVMNAKVPHANSKKTRHAYGLAIEGQDKILDDMSDMVKRMRVIGNHSMLPFQKGIIQSNKALKMLFEDIKSRFNVKYVLTYRLNKDVLENFFDLIRFQDGLHNHPDQQEFECRLRKYLLGVNESSIIHDSVNVEDHVKVNSEITQPPLTSILLKKLKVTSQQYPKKKVVFKDLGFDGLEHLDGVICNKLEGDIPSTSFKGKYDPLCLWAKQLSDDSLFVPSCSMMDQMRCFE